MLPTVCGRDIDTTNDDEDDLVYSPFFSPVYSLAPLCLLHASISHITRDFLSSSSSGISFLPSSHPSPHTMFPFFSSILPHLSSYNRCIALPNSLTSISPLAKHHASYLTHTLSRPANQIGFFLSVKCIISCRCASHACLHSFFPPLFIVLSACSFFCSIVG